MEILLGCLVGVLMSASVWLMLSRGLVKFLFGLVLISNVANLVIFLSGGLTIGEPALIPSSVSYESAKENADPLAAAASGTLAYANALPQALVLTAIVIGFGLTSFTLILALRAWQMLGTADVDEMFLAERRTDGTDAVDYENAVPARTGHPSPSEEPPDGRDSSSRGGTAEASGS